MVKSKCCNKKVVNNEHFTYCSSCLKPLNSYQLINYYKKTGNFLIGIFFLGIIFTSFDLYAPINKLKAISYSAEKAFGNLEYSVDIMQIRIIESGDKNDKVSVAGAIGNMQIMPIALEDLNKMHPNERYSEKDLYNKFINVKVGTWLIEERIPQILKLNDVPLTINNILIAYNWGGGNAVKWYKNDKKIKNLPQETQQYIIKYWAKF
jgi:hypothetical protein